MARIACVLGHDFEDIELKDPYDAFRDAGHRVDIIGVKAGQELAGKRGKVTINADLAVSDARAADYDALFIPGGHSPDNLRADADVVRFVAELDRSGKPVFAICHGPQLLMAARRVEGRTLTAWKTVQGDLGLIDGVSVRDEPVVVDRNWVTSRQPSDIPDFIEAALGKLEATAAARPEAR